MFFVQHEFFGFKTNKQFLVKRGVATKRFFLSTCVLQNVKSYGFLGGPFLGQILGDVQKALSKSRYFSTYLKAKKLQKMAIFNGY